jgi:hypothetical protein
MNELTSLAKIPKMFVESYSGDDDMLCSSVEMEAKTKSHSQYPYAIRIHRKYESGFSTKIHQVKTDLGWTVLYTRYLNHVLREK